VIPTTPTIQKLVREGRATPRDAALLMELRGHVSASRRRIKFREHPFLSICVFVGMVFLSVLGVQRES
jgi:hypothetical protein